MTQNKAIIISQPPFCALSRVQTFYTPALITDSHPVSPNRLLTCQSAWRVLPTSAHMLSAPFGPPSRAHSARSLPPRFHHCAALFRSAQPAYLHSLIGFVVLYRVFLRMSRKIFSPQKFRAKRAGTHTGPALINFQYSNIIPRVL